MFAQKRIERNKSFNCESINNDKSMKFSRTHPEVSIIMYIKKRARMIKNYIRKRQNGRSGETRSGQLLPYSPRGRETIHRKVLYDQGTEEDLHLLCPTESGQQLATRIETNSRSPKIKTRSKAKPVASKGDRRQSGRVLQVLGSKTQDQ